MAGGEATVVSCTWSMDKGGLFAGAGKVRLGRAREGGEKSELTVDSCAGRSLARRFPLEMGNPRARGRPLGKIGKKRGNKG